MSAGLDKLATRLNYLGGKNPVDRMNAVKLSSLKSALKDSYQSVIIQRYDGEEFKCLINPDRVVPDYDNKIISISNEAALKAGDTFYWRSNNTHWLIYLQELNETAYFRAYIRRCKYSLRIGNSDYYVYIKGPSESNISWSQKSGIMMNSLNSSLTMYIANTPDSLLAMQRFKKVDLNGHRWEIKASDAMSMEGVIEVSLGEYFDNPTEKLQIVPAIVPINTAASHIEGPTFVKPYDTGLEYFMKYSSPAEEALALAIDSTWSVSNAKAKIATSNKTQAQVEIVSGRSGTFDLIHSGWGNGEIILTITIESL